ncbi:MAG: hypothetical protein C4530_01300 [Desulfobacteraceae bacterium]|nr:MAG: hypothetical protein C4530_01300 [Desulfobacteraceae bacterium]
MTSDSARHIESAHIPHQDVADADRIGISFLHRVLEAFFRPAPFTEAGHPHSDRFQHVLQNIQIGLMIVHNQSLFA